MTKEQTIEAIRTCLSHKPWEGCGPCPLIDVFTCKVVMLKNCLIHLEREEKEE